MNCTSHAMPGRAPGRSQASTHPLGGSTAVLGGRGAQGFTLIELLVVLAIITTLLSIGLPRYYDSVKRSEEAALKQNLALLRESIDKHFADTGRYPQALEDLVAKRYLRKLPKDPVTDSSESWQVVAPPAPLPGAVYDVKSGSEALARDGTPFNTW